MLRLRQIIGVFLLSLFGLTLAAAGEEGTRLELPVLGSTEAALTVAVSVLPAPATERYAWGAIPSLTGTEASRTDPAMVALEYLHRILDGDYAAVSVLYPAADRHDPQIETFAQLLRGLLTETLPPTEVRIHESWLFGDFRVLLLEMPRRDGGSELFSLGLQRIEGRFYRSDNWREHQAVQQLFWLMTGNRRQGMEPIVVGASRPGLRRRSRPGLRLELSTGGVAGPLEVSLAGTLHGSSAQSAEASDSLDNEGTAADFAQRALLTAANGNDEAFLRLWHRQDFEQIVQLAAERSGGFSGLVESLRVAEIRDVFTVELGDVAVHYFIEAAAPAELRALLLRRQGDTWRLTTSLQPNLEAFLTSEPLRHAILRSWTTEQGGIES